MTGSSTLVREHLETALLNEFNVPFSQVDITEKREAQAVVDLVLRVLAERLPLKTRHDAPNATATGWSRGSCWADGYNTAVMHLIGRSDN